MLFSLGIQNLLPNPSTSVRCPVSCSGIGREHPSSRGTVPMSWHSGTSFDPPTGGLGSSQHASPRSPNPDDEGAARKRKRISIVTENGDIDPLLSPAGGVGGGAPGSAGGFAGSPTSNGKQRHQPGVKRACNDCRQQKVRLRRCTHRIPRTIFIHPPMSHLHVRC